MLFPEFQARHFRKSLPGGNLGARKPVLVELFAGKYEQERWFGVRIPGLHTLILMVKPRGLSENGRLRNRFQARCKKVVRRSKRRTGRSYYRRASPILMKRPGKRSPPLAKRTGHPFTLSFDVVATRRLTRKISSRVFLFIYLNRIR